MKLTIIKPLHLKHLEIEQVSSIYCPKESFYITTDEDAGRHMSSIDQVKRERDRAISRYQNVLKGLEYWRKRATT